MNQRRGLQVVKTTKNRAQDEELRRLNQRLSDLEDQVQQAGATVTPAPQNITVNAVPSGAAQGDLAGFYPRPDVVGIQETPVSNASPTDQQQLVYIGSDSQWEPTNLAVGGDLTGTLPNPSLAANSVDADEIVNGSITDAKLAKFYERVLSVNTADSSPIANTVAGAETLFSLNYTLPANTFAVGTVLRVTVGGVWSDTGTPTLQLKLKFGTTLVFDMTAITLANTVTNRQWRAEFVIVCRATGGSGSISTDGINLVVGTTVIQVARTLTTIDTTASQQMQMSATWGTQSSSNTTTQTLLLVEQLA